MVGAALLGLDALGCSSASAGGPEARGGADVVALGAPAVTPAAPAAPAPVAAGLHHIQRLASGGARFLRDARAIVFEEGDEPLRVLDGGRTEPFPELGWHLWDPQDITGLGGTRVIALAGTGPGRMVGVRIRTFFNGQTVKLVEPVTRHAGRWNAGELIESFAGLGAWKGGCVITPSMEDVQPIFEGPGDPTFRPHFVVLGCRRAVELPILPPPDDLRWHDAFGSTAAGHAVLVGRKDHDVVIHHWVAGRREGRRHVLPGLTVDSRMWKQLDGEAWLADERNPIVWRSATEPVVFLRARDTREPIVDDSLPAPSLDSVVAHPEGATWRSATLPGVQLERFAAGPDGAIWMTGGGRLWRMRSLEVVESVELAPLDDGDRPTVPIDVLPIGPRTLWLIAEHGPASRREVSLFRYEAADPIGPTLALTPR